MDVGVMDGCVASGVYHIECSMQSFIIIDFP